MMYYLNRDVNEVRYDPCKELEKKHKIKSYNFLYRKFKRIIINNKIS